MCCGWCCRYEDLWNDYTYAFISILGLLVLLNIGFIEAYNALQRRALAEKREEEVTTPLKPHLISL